MSRAVVLGVGAVVATAFLSGCGMFKKEAYLVPTDQGWVEMQSKDNGSKIKMKPAERVEVK